jgi:hypothetical protein
MHASVREADMARSATNQDSNFDRGQKQTHPEATHPADEVKSRRREAEIEKNVEDARNDPPPDDAEEEPA